MPTTQPHKCRYTHYMHAIFHTHTHAAQMLKRYTHANTDMHTEETNVGLGPLPDLPSGLPEWTPRGTSHKRQKESPKNEEKANSFSSRCTV